MKDQILITLAGSIADKIYSDPANNKAQDQQAIMNAIELFSVKDFTETTEPFMNCKGLLTEIACLLTDPEVSSKLNESYYKKNAGRLLLNMLEFFREMDNDPAVKRYIIYNRLKTRAGEMSPEEIGWFADRSPLQN